MLLSPLQQQATWRFDMPSFLIGCIAAAMVAGLLYVFRQPLRDGMAQVGERVRYVRERLTAGAERRYLEALTARLDELHVGDLAAPFADVYLPARFTPPTPRPSLTAEAADVHVVPLSRALASTHRLAVSGPPGSGRTALLCYLARVFAAGQAQDELGLAETRLPVLIHLAEIDRGARPEGEEPGTALIDATILHVPRLVAANIASLLKARLKSGHLLVLLDGWDELAEHDRDAAREWLAALIKQYPDHRYVVAVSPRDADAATGAGLASLTMFPLQARPIRALADRWVAAAGGGASDATMLAETMRQPPGIDPLPLDITLAAGLWRQRGSVPLSTPAAYDQWIDLALTDGGVSDTLAARAVLGRLAWTLLEEGRLISTRDEAAAIAAETLPPPEAGQPAPGAEEVAGNLARASALLIGLGHGVAFAHPRITAYLAAAHARDSGQAMALAARLDDAAWVDVTYFFAALGDATPLVNAALARPDDLFRTTARRLGTWASIAPLDAPWRSRFMGDMVKTLMAPNTPEPLRDELLRAAVATRDKGLPYLFKQATGRPEPALRQLGLRGFGLLRREADVAHILPLVQDAETGVRAAALHALGEIGGQAAVDGLAQALLDMDDDGRRAAAEALANCGKAGWDLLKEGASLADDHGPDVVSVRRAVTYGLARVGEDWAREVLAKLEREDKQWYVRSAATDALKQIDEESGQGGPLDLTPLDRDNLGWLVQWAASKGQGIGLGKSADQALQRALADLDPKVRLAAIHTYSAIGDADIIPALKQRLIDDDAAVRTAAYRALECIAQRTGAVVPM